MYVCVCVCVQHTILINFIRVSGGLFSIFFIAAMLRKMMDVMFGLKIDQYYCDLCQLAQTQTLTHRHTCTHTHGAYTLFCSHVSKTLAFNLCLGKSIGCGKGGGLGIGTAAAPAAAQVPQAMPQQQPNRVTLLYV